MAGPRNISVSEASRPVLPQFAVLVSTFAVIEVSWYAVYASLGDRVRMASAVIHSARTAVALQYLGENDLPRVIARGEGEVAAQIRRFAGEGLVPMEFEPSLAERIYAEVPVDQPIPRSLYAPVARLLRWAQGIG